MRRQQEPNVSHYSARYAERKRAQERTRDAAAPPRTCNRCATVAVKGSIFCAEHASEYAALLSRPDVTPDECSAFCQRSHWP